MTVMAVKKIEHDLWIVARRSEDVEGQWVAHCLDFDVIGERDSLQSAVESAQAQARDLIYADLEDREIKDRSAPENFWEEKERIVKFGEAVEFGEAVQDAQKGENFILALKVKVVAVVNLELIQGGKQDETPELTTFRCRPRAIAS